MVFFATYVQTNQSGTSTWGATTWVARLPAGLIAKDLLFIEAIKQSRQTARLESSDTKRYASEFYVRKNLR